MHPTAARGPPRRLEAIRAYIARHLSAPITPDHLADRFACSRAQLYRLFQPLGGVATYMREARLQQAFQELSATSGPPRRILDTAMRWGFSSQSHFNRLFRRRFGVTPGEVRELARRHGGRPRDELPALRELLCAL